LPWSFAKTRDLVAHLWIPAIVLGTSGTASLIRILRNNLLDELAKPYVATALSKGVSNLRVILKYPVRVAFNPLISTMAYLLPALINGSIIVSLVLSLPTLGPVLLEAIEVEDVGLAGVIILMSGALTVVGTFLSDIVLGIVDPRIKYTSE
jgi:peptide/nickel transport system permease protein